MKDAELAVDKAFSNLTQSILERYHEEQVWSDKIRSVSTWAGAIGLLVNAIVFVGAIAFVEPWKRRRLVQRLEERMSGMIEKVDGGIAVLGQRIDALQPGSVESPPTKTLTASRLEDDEIMIKYLPPHSLPEPRWTSSLPWLPSNLAGVAQPSIERDLAAIGLFGAASGAALAAVVFRILRG